MTRAAHGQLDTSQRGVPDGAGSAEDFTNPAGNVLGAFQAAMLFDTVGPALLATLAPDEFQSTMSLSVSFLRPVRPGRITGQGRIVHRDGPGDQRRPGPFGRMKLVLGSPSSA